MTGAGNVLRMIVAGTSAHVNQNQAGSRKMIGQPLGGYQHLRPGCRRLFCGGGDGALLRPERPAKGQHEERKQYARFHLIPSIPKGRWLCLVSFDGTDGFQSTRKKYGGSNKQENVSVELPESAWSPSAAPGSFDSRARSRALRSG